MNIKLVRHYEKFTKVGVFWLTEYVIPTGAWKTKTSKYRELQPDLYLEVWMSGYNWFTYREKNYKTWVHEDELMIETINECGSCE